MACLSPNRISVEREKVSKTGKNKVRFLGPYDGDRDFQDLKDGLISLVPCGKCLQCRLDYARHWADRMQLEYISNPHACFVTLTYNDEHLHLSDDGYPTLVKSDVSRFMKNLRGRKEILGKEVRFFAAGEYGEKFHRPHVHIILFGIDLEFLANIQPLIYRGKNELNQIYWQSVFLDDVWSDENGKIGFTEVSEASWDSMNYVARYTVKKAQGSTWTDDKDIQPEFTLMSRRPGIGAKFLDMPENFSRLQESDVLYSNSKKIFFPKYIQDRYWKIGESHVQALDRFGCAVHTYVPQFHYEYIKRKRDRVDLMNNNTIVEFEKNQRTYKEIQNDKLMLLTDRVKILKRGDVALS